MARTRWTLDTCGCVLEIDWDPAVPPASRTHTLATVVTACPLHPLAVSPVGATVESDQIAPAADNRRVGRAVAAAMARLPAKLQQTDADGTVRLREGVGLEWTFSGTGATRVVTLRFPGVTFTNAERNQVQGAIDTAVGVGKAVLG